ncbi:NAD-dependent epimerase/dehydratase family protein [Candidatus Micrarchaeota archaeon]|nr:NAD-dependent epimerase/dehydratase family protein [Candidatus Micrarchaeota archaeon]
MNKNLITGGAGFIGSHLADALQDVVVYDDFSYGRRENFKGSIVTGDILDTSALEKALEGVETVYHFAALANVRECEADPAKAYRLNVRGTKVVLEACRKKNVPNFIFASSSAVYGDTTEKKTEDAQLKPESKYGQSKKEAEEAVRAYAERYGMNCTVLRFANIYGPRSRLGVMWDFYHKLQKDNGKLEILGDGLQAKSYVYVSDAIEGTLKAREKTKGFEIYNVASEPTTVNDLAKTMASLLGLDPKFTYAGGKTGWKGDVPRSLMDASKLRALGWQARVGLREGIEKYIGWMKTT